MLKSKTEKIIFGIIIIVSVVLRFWGLGWSNFYGDETKTLYLDKTVVASDFFLNQRKGPVQFFVVWSVEKLIGGYSELWVRVPFAIAGVLSVIVLYLLVKKLFNWQISAIATSLYALSGFSIAFSRTAQYQSFLLLFSLLSIYTFILALEKKEKFLYLLSAVLLALAFYSHYDAIFYLIPIVFLIIKQKTLGRKALIYFVLPFLSLVSVFYIPYIFEGYLMEHTIGYLERRLTGSDHLINNSMYTTFLYNPTVVFFLMCFAGFFSFLKKEDIGKRDLLWVWFLVPFIVFQFVILNPGTHIQHYYIPLYILAGYTLYSLGKTYVPLVVLSLLFIAFTSFRTFIPKYNTTYPWNKNINRDYQLFLYGFPYNVGWDQVQDYMYKQSGVTGVYTNDNDTIAEYYLRKLDYTPPGTNFAPQYYIHVYANQEFLDHSPRFSWDYLRHYTKVKNIYVGKTLTATIFKLK